MRSLLLLGSTGSIGTQTLELVERDPGAFRVAGLSAQRSWRALLDQVRRHRPPFVALADPEAAEALAPELPPGTTLFRGPEANLELIAAASFDLAVHGIVGAAGLLPSVAVLERGRPLALANKESLVLAGAILMELAKSRGGRILPVDSEHCAIFQCLAGEDVGRVRRVLLTASGGPFRDTPTEKLAHVGPSDALAHPTWDMGPRITIGSATLMNKALEVIEAHHLFGLAPEQIEVVVHRQSVVHSLVEFVDGSVIAQCGPPDMRGPIHWALHHPERRPAGLPGFSLEVFRELTFEAPDRARFPALDLGYRAIALGGDAGARLNAADEVAVAAFLDGRLPFSQIAAVCGEVLASGVGPANRVEDVLHADRSARSQAERLAAGDRAPLPANAPRS